MMKRFLQRKNTRMYHVWLRSFMVCLCLALAGVSAWGQDGFYVSGDESKYTYSKGVLEITGTGVTVKNKDINTPTGDRIVIKGGSVGSPIDVSLEGVNINTGYNSPISIENESFVIINLSSDDNKLICTNCNAVNIKSSTTQQSSLKVKGDGKLYITTTSSSSWAIGGDDSEINIESGTIQMLESEDGRFGSANGIGGNNTKINILGGNLYLSLSGSCVGIGDSFNSKESTSEIIINGGNIMISGKNNTGENVNAYPIKGGNLSTEKNGSAVIKVSHVKKTVEVKDVDKSNWNVIILDDWDPYTNITEGFLYGIKSLDEDFNLESEYSLIVDPASDIIFNGHSFTNEGRTYFAFKKQNLDESISGGLKYYQVFYDLANTNIPEELKNGILTNQYIESDEKIEKKEMYSEQGTFLFAKSGDQVTLKWKDDSNAATGGKYPIYNGWELESFKVKKTATEEEIPVKDLSFTMPEEAITIYDIKLKKRKYVISTKSITKGLEVKYVKENGDVIDENMPIEWGDDIYAIITAPGYETYSINQIKGGTDLVSVIFDDIEEAQYKFTMPAFNILISIVGTVTTAKEFKLYINQPENGEINVEYGDGVNKDNLHYKDLIKVSTIPDEGYELKSLVYSYEENGSPVTKDIERGSFTMPAADVTISAVFEKIKYTVTATVSNDSKDMGTVEGGGEYAEGDPVTITATPKEGYEFKSWTVESGNVTLDDENQATTTFIMPANNVTVTATFTEKEDPTDPEEPVDPPVDPINYYNIYNETTYDFIDVSFSRNVVREGGSVNVYLGIPEGLDPAAVTLMFKRSLYGGWENLNTDDDGNYLINNIWTDIYVKAVVDESYIDPNPDENHIYIDLSETNDSIWLYTDHKLVEEGKTAVIQAEVAKSCQNKEIRYMYKRTVLGEWKEMPKDYSINQYVVRDITTDIYVKAYFVFDKQDPTTAKNPHHVYADITATCEGLYLDATRHKVADEGDTKVFLYVKKGFETKDARYLFKRGLKGEWEDLVPGIEQNTFQVTDIEGDIYLKGIDAVYTGTEDIDGMVRVYTKDGSLFVYTAQPEEISVVSMTGVTVKRTRQTGLQSYPLNQGIYVVCVGEQVFKVRVK